MKRLLFVSILSVVIFMDNAFSSNEVCRTTGSATSTQHVTGIVTLKILLVEFSDVKHRTSPSAYTKTDFENLFFSSGIYVSPHMYSPNNESVYGSMNDYYQKMSNGNLSITGHIVNTVQNNIPIWLNFPNTKAYCDTDNNFMYDVINTATAQGLDVGNLGNLTKLVIIYAGNVYWGGYLNPMAISIPGNFYIMSERNGGPTNPNGEHSTDVFSRIGVHCHEFGHCIGINHSSGSRADIMEAGYRNGPNYDGYNGAAPAPFNPIARWSMGWLTDTIISGDQQKNAYYSLTAPQVFQINSNSNGDYFLTENRRFDQTMVIGTTTVPDYNNAAWMPIGQTQNTPNTNIQEGILVWRVRGGMALDYNSNGLIYASGRYGASYPDNHPSQTDAGDVFPGTAGTTILSPYSDSRDPGNTEGNHYTLYVPNTKGGTNVGMEVLSENTTGGYFTLRLHSAQQVLPSTISSSQTLNGEYISTSNVTINSGVTVNISAGSTLVFQSGTSIYNNGILNVNGTLSQPIKFTSQTGNSQNSWGNIQYNSGSSGSLNYSIIRYANNGIYENSVNVDISNSAISNCTNGIYMYNSSSATIYCTNIHNNSYAGIYLTSSSPKLYNNYIINNSSYGVYCTTNSNPKFGNGSRQGMDSISNNSYGVFCWNNSAPMLGNNSPVDGGQNNILYNSSWNLYSLYSGVILAVNNWWGSTTPSNFKISSGSGSVTWSPYRTSPATISPRPTLSKTNGNSIAEGSNDIPLLSDLQKAMELIATNNLAEARKICLNLITNYPDYAVSYNALNLLKDTYSANEISSSKENYKSLFNTKGKKNLYAMAGLMLADIDKGNKLSLIDNVINNYKNESVVELALFDKFVCYYFDKADTVNALAVSKELDKTFPQSMGATEAHRILGDKEYYNVNNINVNQLQPLQKTTVETPITYALLGNFPNPFNPTTNISYQLPETARVTLKVYDMLGREVAKLVDGEMETGKYSVTFNGTGLSSGIYFVRFMATPQNGNQTITKTLKMLMVK